MSSTAPGRGWQERARWAQVSPHERRQQEPQASCRGHALLRFPDQFQSISSALAPIAPTSCRLSSTSPQGQVPEAPCRTTAVSAAPHEARSQTGREPDWALGGLAPPVLRDTHSCPHVHTHPSAPHPDPQARSGSVPAGGVKGLRRARCVCRARGAMSTGPGCHLTN